jgi:hypothetical protein
MQMIFPGFERGAPKRVPAGQVGRLSIDQLDNAAESEPNVAGSKSATIEARDRILPTLSITPGRSKPFSPQRTNFTFVSS